MGWVISLADLQAQIAAAQAAADASLKKSQNLADLTSASVARNNLGSNQVFLETRFDDLRAATGQVRYLAWPLTGAGGFAIALIVTLEGALAAGDATIAIAINGTPTDPATLTLAQAGSAAGAKYEVTFVGANAVPADATISLTVGGANTAQVGAAVEFVAIF